MSIRWRKETGHWKTTLHSVTESVTVCFNNKMFDFDACCKTVEHFDNELAGMNGIDLDQSDWTGFEWSQHHKVNECKTQIIE